MSMVSIRFKLIQHLTLKVAQQKCLKYAFYDTLKLAHRINKQTKRQTTSTLELLSD